MNEKEKQHISEKIQEPKNGPEIYFDGAEAYHRTKEIFAPDQYDHFFGFTLPHGTDFGKKLLAREAIQLVGNYTHQTDSKPNPETTSAILPVVLAPVSFEGIHTYSILLSDVAIKTFDPYEGIRSFYRFDTLDGLAKIQQYGFYQILGRTTFFTNDRATGWLNNRVAVVYELPHNEVIQGRSPNTAALAFPIDVKFKDGTLPETLKQELGELHFVGRLEIPEDKNGTLLQRQTLLAGDLSKVLLRLPPERINRKKTLETNYVHLENGQLTKENFQKLENILSDPPK